jgi:hypothetical protein
MAAPQNPSEDFSMLKWLLPHSFHRTKPLNYSQPYTRGGMPLFPNFGGYLLMFFRKRFHLGTNSRFGFSFSYCLIEQLPFSLPPYYCCQVPFSAKFANWIFLVYTAMNLYCFNLLHYVTVIISSFAIPHFSVYISGFNADWPRPLHLTAHALSMRCNSASWLQPLHLLLEI